MFAFSKYTGAGNDFILMDDLDNAFPLANPQIIQRLCHRHLGVGADGVILLQSSKHADFRMRIFNADGTEAEMCGNGIRCLAKFIQQIGHPHEKLTIETMHRLLNVHYQNEEVCVDMGTPQNIEWNIQVEDDLFPQTLNLHVMDTGVPHAVLFLETHDAMEISLIGRKIRHHPLFQPKGVNANFAHVDQQGDVWNRTYERGVEGETQACGTGATAAALAASQLYSLKSPVKVHTKSGEVLSIFFEWDGSSFYDVAMQGPAKLVFQGQVQINDL